MISLKNITKSYQNGSGKAEVLHNLNLDIPQGGFISLVGASGSGKSTLLNLIGLLDKADSGSYFLAGHNILSLSCDDLAILRNRKIGFIFQNFCLLSQFPAWYNVALPLFYRDNYTGDYKDIACKYLEKLGLLDFAYSYPNTLSGGQKQRLAIARAMITEPDIILADEPTGSLDSSASSDVMQWISKLNSDFNTTILLVTHDKDVARYAHKIITITDGGLEDLHE